MTHFPLPVPDPDDGAAVPSDRSGDVLVVGDLMVDVVAAHDEPIRFGTDTSVRTELAGGGSAANTACWLAELGAGARLVAAVGDDALGHGALEELAGSGVRFAGVQLADSATGTCVVLVSPDRERTMLPDRGANDHLDVPTVLRAFAEPPRLVHLSGYALLGEGSRDAGLAVIAEARRVRCPVTVDAASSGPLTEIGADRFLAWIDGCNLVFGNDEEIDALGGVEVVLTHVAAVVTKHGAAGATWTDGDATISHAGVAVEAVDSTGAGDAFAAGWLAGPWGQPSAADHAGIVDALARATSCGARAVTRPGARPR